MKSLFGRQQRHSWIFSASKHVFQRICLICYAIEVQREITKRFHTQHCRFHTEHSSLLIATVLESHIDVAGPPYSILFLCLPSCFSSREFLNFISHYWVFWTGSFSLTSSSLIFTVNFSPAFNNAYQGLSGLSMLSFPSSYGYANGKPCSNFKAWTSGS